MDRCKCIFPEDGGNSKPYKLEWDDEDATVYVYFRYKCLKCGGEVHKRNWYYEVEKTIDLPIEEEVKE